MGCRPLWPLLPPKGTYSKGSGLSQDPEFYQTDLNPSSAWTLHILVAGGVARISGWRSCSSHGEWGCLLPVSGRGELGVRGGKASRATHQNRRPPRLPHYPVCLSLNPPEERQVAWDAWLVLVPDCSAPYEIRMIPVPGEFLQSARPESKPLVPGRTKLQEARNSLTPSWKCESRGLENTSLS